VKILITGGKGQLGRALEDTLSSRYQIYAPAKEKLDVSEPLKLEHVVQNYKPDVIIHTAALTNVDKCETEAERAIQINTYGTQNIATAALISKAKLVYISTNFIFNGIGRIPYKEDNLPDPVNIYGFSKLAGEKLIKEILGSYFIVRTSWLYGPGKNNFVDRIVAMAEERNELNVVGDQYSTPTYTYDLAQAISNIISTEFYGTYHISNKGFCSRYEWVKEIFDFLGYRMKIRRVNSSSFSNSARRPEFAVLDNTTYKNVAGMELRDWRDALHSYLSHLQLKRAL
jgi:dTDP-4-dehydrorhamnose reductase